MNITRRLTRASCKKKIKKGKICTCRCSSGAGRAEELSTYLCGSAINTRLPHMAARADGGPHTFPFASEKNPEPFTIHLRSACMRIRLLIAFALLLQHRPPPDTGVAAASRVGAVPASATATCVLLKINQLNMVQLCQLQVLLFRVVHVLSFTRTSEPSRPAAGRR